MQYISHQLFAPVQPHVPAVTAVLCGHPPCSGHPLSAVTMALAALIPQAAAMPSLLVCVRAVLRVQLCACASLCGLSHYP